jgi:ParB-like chromosome segregation protein Spo0J
MSKQVATVSKDLALCPYQKFVVERWDRRKIKNAPYNPRTISKDAQKRLTAKIKKRGLLQAVTVNSVTSNIVGGHKRLAILDALMGTSAYLLYVCVVKLAPQQEREENIAFNNPALGGDWDLVALADVLPGLDLDATGFDQVGMEALLGEQGKGLFSEEEQTPETKAVVDDLDEMTEAREQEAAEAKDRRQKMREKGKSDRQDLDTARIAMVVFPSRKAKDAWLEKLGLEAGTRYVDHKVLS